jgi:hypothetical protein
MIIVTLAEFRRRIAYGFLRRVEDAVVEGDFESAKQFADELLDFACALAIDELAGHVEVLKVAEELWDVKGFPFE